MSDVSHSVMMSGENALIKITFQVSYSPCRDSCTCDTECYILQFLTNAPLSPKQGGGIYSNYLSSGSIMGFSDYATVNGQVCMTENVCTKQGGSETTHIVEVR